MPKLIMKQEDLERAKLQNEEEAELLRSARYENFDESMVNEYVSSDEDNNAIIEEGKDVTYDMKDDRNDPTAVGTQEMAEAICQKMGELG